MDLYGKRSNIGESLKSFQTENGLKVDGLMNPGGPTESAMSQTLANQGIGNTDLLEKAENILPSHISIEKNGDTGFTASASFSPQEAERPKAQPKVKLDPLTGLPDPLAKVSKPKADMKKAWDNFYKQKAETAKNAIIPQGDTVQSRIQSMMTDKRYGDKNDTRLRDHVSKQFERAYPGEVQYDETGRMIQPKSVITPEEVKPFDPDGELLTPFNGKDAFTYSVSDSEHDQATDAFQETTKSDAKSPKNNFQKYRENLAEKEGGYVNHPKDKGGPTNKGVSQEYLDQLRRDPDWAHLPKTTKELSHSHIEGIFKDRFYTKPKIDKLEKVSGLEKASPQLADQIYDAGVQHGIEKPARWLQEALLEIADIDLRETNPKTGEKYFDGNIGPKTREAISQAIKSGKIKDINNLIVQKRLALMRRDITYQDFKNGWEKRANSFIQD